MRNLLFILVVLGMTLPCWAQPAGAPPNATYITNFPSNGLTNEFALSGQLSGMLKNTAGAGMSIATAGTDYIAPLGTPTFRTVRITPSASSQNQLRLDWSDGSTRLQMGTYPGNDNYGVSYYGLVTPDQNNYSLTGDGSTEFVINAPASGSTKFRVGGSGPYLSLDNAKITAAEPIWLASGSVAAPGLAWSADADGSGTGFYRSATNEIAVAVNGVNEATWSSSGLALADPLSMGYGGTGATNPITAKQNLRIQTTLRTGLVAYWPLNEASGDRYDIQSRAVMQDVNTVLSNTGLTYTLAADFENSPSNAEYLSYQVNSLTTFSFSAYIKLESAPGSAYIIMGWAQTPGSSTFSHILGVNSSRQLLGYLFDGSVKQVAGATTLSLGQWYHVVMTVSSGGSLNLYVNGNLDGTVAINTPYSGWSGTPYLMIGGYAGSPFLETFDGLIQGAGLWSKVLSGTEITQLNNSGSGIPATEFGNFYGTLGKVDNAVPRADGTSGDTFQSSGITIDDSNNLILVNPLGVSYGGTGASTAAAARTNLGVDVKALQLVAFAPTTDVATGDGKFYFHIPASLNGGVITSVHAMVITAGTTGTTDIQIARIRSGTPADVLSTKLTIDSTETGSDTAATAAVINGSNDDLQTNDILRVDVDAVSTTAPKGLNVTIEVTK